VLLHREGADETHEGEYVGRMIITKQRQGEKGDFGVRFTRAMTFERLNLISNKQGTLYA